MQFGAAPDLSSLLEFDRRALLVGEVWRLWTGHLVHYSAQHALIDLATAFIAAIIAAQSFGALRVLAALALGAPFISLGLLLAAPHLAHYRGASGLAVLLAVMAGAGLWRRVNGVNDTRAASGRLVRSALSVLTVTLAVKIGAEAGGWSMGGSDLPGDVVVAWQAHLLGAAFGAAAVLACARCVRKAM